MSDQFDDALSRRTSCENHAGFEKDPTKDFTRPMVEGDHTSRRCRDKISDVTLKKRDAVPSGSSGSAIAFMVAQLLMFTLFIS